MKFLFYIIVFLLFSCARPISQDEEISLLQIAPKILATEGTAVFLAWEFPEASYMWHPNKSEVPFIEAYKDSIEELMGKSKMEVAVLIEASQNKVLTDDTLSMNGDQLNSARVKSGAIGTIHEINFIEAQLLNYQLSRYPLLSCPTEFHGFILKDSVNKRIRLYFAASDQRWPPKAHRILDEIERDLKGSWKLKFHMHNHYRDPDEFVGVLAPSLADAHYYKMLRNDFNVAYALISNGFHTLQASSSEFDKFESH
jgi:hypothetical protein